MINPKIAAIVVTYNRLALLQECITALRMQSRLPDKIFIINNGSTDGTAEWLSSQNDITVITQPNAGSSGGQYSGVKYAVDNNFDWVWCMDDDTITTPGALEAFVSSEYFNVASSFLCSTVLWQDDTLHKMNIPLRKAGYNEEEYPSLKSSEVIYCSFVSVLINTAAVKAAGYPLKKMFIWYDDLEYTIRLRKYGPGYLIGNSVVYHKTVKNIGPDFLPKGRRLNPKELLGIRNYLFIRKNIYPFDKRKTNHLYIYVKSVLGILKYGLITKQFGTTLKAIMQGLFMSKKQTG
ncbi:MAG: glycosyltransferase [Chitinophagaceae bacterium]|nr:glycosyltransferase [Chitinophagaceae bacterium]